MSEVVIYGVPGSPYVRMPILACEEKGAPYRLVPLGPGDTKSAEHLARQPFGRIPAIEHEGSTRPTPSSATSTRCSKALASSRRTRRPRRG